MKASGGPRGTVGYNGQNVMELDDSIQQGWCRRKCTLIETPRVPVRFNCGLIMKSEEIGYSVSVLPVNTPIPIQPSI